MARQLILWHRWLPPRADEPEGYGALADWERQVVGRMTVAGAEILARLSGTVVAALEPDEIGDAVETALDLLAEAEAAGVPVAIAATLGPVKTIDGAVTGGAPARAQQLASRARAGELVLGPDARHAAAAEYLFGRQVNAGAGAARGVTVDRAHPRRADASSSVGALSAPVFPPLGDPLLDELEAALTDRSSRTFILRGPVGAGARELVAALAARVEADRVFQLGASPGGLVPLASLRLSLLRRFASPQGVGESMGPVLARVASGELVPRAELAADLAAHLRPQAGGLAWVVLSPCGLIDGASLAAILDARAAGADFVIIGRLGVDAELPRPLAELDEPLLERTVPALRPSDARVVARAVLGDETEDDVARRVGVLGGETVVGVVEAARTLLATGELVPGPGGYTWRVGPREGAGAIGTAELLAERVALLDDPSRRLLEVLCVIPDGETRSLLAAAAGRDGLEGGAFDAALERLFRDGFARYPERPRPATSLLRVGVRAAMDPARAAALHLAVGEALRDRGGREATLPALLGYYLYEGGEELEGEARLGGCVEPLVDAGYERAARQIRGWLDPQSRDPWPGEEPHEEGPPSSELPLDELLGGPSPPPDAPALPALSDAQDALTQATTPGEAPAPTEDPAPADASRPPAVTAPAVTAPAVTAPAVTAPAVAPPPPPASPLAAVAPPPPPTREPHLDAPGRSAAPSPAAPPPPPPAARALRPRLDEPPTPAMPVSLELDLDEPAEEMELEAEELELVEDSATRRLAEPAPSPGSLDLALDELIDEPTPPAGPLALELDEALEDPLEEGVDELVSEELALDDYDREPTSVAPAPRPPEESVVDPTASELDLELDALVSRPFPAPRGTAPLPRLRDDGEREETTSVAPAPMRPFVLEAAQALRDRDFVALEEVIEHARADGVDPRAVERVRAFAALARGDVGAAERALGEVASTSDARTMLMRALVALHGGEPAAGVRAGLVALARARRGSDARGEAAALHALAACYRALGREADADRLEALRAVV